MEEMIEKLKKINNNIWRLYQSLYVIKDFNKKFNIHEQYFHFKDIAEEYIAIYKRLERTHSPSLMCYLNDIEKKVEQIVKYLEYHKLNTEESKNFFDCIKEHIKEIKIIIMYF